MAEDIENESIRISELPETTQVDKSNDCLVISKTSDIYSTGSKSYKITPQNLLDGVGVDYTAGDNITISVDNVISATIPTASSSDLGGVKVGSGLSINSEGVLSATGGGGGASSFSDLDDVSINEHTLVNGQVPVYNSATQKWENMNQSGGGSGHTILDDEGTSLTQRDDLQFKGAYSEDDSTNEKTVVNVARTMTLAEFEQLTEDEKAGFINVADETSGSDDKFQPVIYSEEEREIGVWTDGKPLYEKTVKIQSLPSSASLVDYPHNISNIDTICASWGYVRWASGSIAPLNTMQFSDGTVGVSSSFFYLVTTTNISIAVGMDRSSSSATVTIRYTKTTDVAGSGQWTPQGVPAHHYSEDEHIVGTWVDGSTVYEKTYIFSSITIPKETWTTVADVSTLNIDRLVSVFGNGSGASQVASVNAFNDNGNLKVFLSFAWGMTSITIRYTKTSI